MNLPIAVARLAAIFHLRFTRGVAPDFHILALRAIMNQYLTDLFIKFSVFKLSLTYV